MDWERDLPTWSHPSLSRRVAVGRVRWHVQEAGQGPLILLIPGAGASVHTWRDVIPVLAETHRVIAIDLPGQGFSQGTYVRMGLDRMAEDLGALIASERWEVSAVVGHSAGAALALQVAQQLDVRRVLGINPALEMFEGAAEWLFPLVARMLAINPFTASIFSLGMSQGRAAKLIENTGSKIDDEGLRYYTRLMRSRTHVAGALQMMAQWKLDAVNAGLPDMKADALFLAGAKDRSVPPRVAERAAAKMPNAQTEMLDGLGHLAHEEDPSGISARIAEFVAQR